MKNTDVLFEGFSPVAISFLEDLKSKNNRDWFNANKEIYLQELKTKALALIHEMQYVFASEDLSFNGDLKKSLFRIYRDIRFSKDKSPYKTHLGIFFPYRAGSRGHKPIETTGLYLHIEPQQCFIAGGLHRPLSQQLKSIRNRIVEDYELFFEIINEEEFKEEFSGILKNESLKRVPQGFEKDHPIAEFIKLKGFSVLANIPCDIIYDRNLIAAIVNKARLMTPFLEFLHNAAFGNTPD